MSNVIPFQRPLVTPKPDISISSSAVSRRSLETLPPFREIKRFTKPTEDLIFIVISNDDEVKVHQSRDDGRTWELALVTSLVVYNRGMSAFWINGPNCQDSESFLEMVRFIQSGYVMPDGFPIPNWWDPAKKWAEIQRSGAIPARPRDRAL